MSPCGSRIFTTGKDGAIFMLAVSKSMVASNGQGGDDYEEASAVASEGVKSSGESSLMLADKKSFERLVNQTLEMRVAMEDKQRDREKGFLKLTEQTDIQIVDLETRLKREVAKRDAIILNERDDHYKQKQELNLLLSSFDRKQREIVAKVELGYEQKLAQEALYLDRMKQVYI
jgi:hypothetical protein